MVSVWLSLVVFLRVREINLNDAFFGILIGRARIRILVVGVVLLGSGLVSCEVLYMFMDLLGRRPSVGPRRGIMPTTIQKLSRIM
jgi:hypothetical protein